MCVQRWVLTAHHILAVQVVQHCAEQLGAGLMVRFTGVVVQLPTQLVSDKWQKHISTICGNRTAETVLIGSHSTFLFNGADLTNLYVGVMHFFPPSSCVKSHYVVFEPRGLLPGCLKRSLSTILHMQPSFWRTSWESGMLSMNFARRTLKRKWKKRAKRAAVTILMLFTFHV